MRLHKSQQITLGTFLILCLGVPGLVYAHSDRFTSDYPDRTSQKRHWSDSQDRHDVSGRQDNERQYYTNQYGDLDTNADQKVRDGGMTKQNKLRRADRNLRQNILDELGDGTERVQVGVRGGVVTLTGMVLNREAMVDSVEIAYEEGARKVKNQLRVFRHDERPWAEMSDRSLATAVREELSWSPYVHEDPIQVNVRKGVVTLKGSVEDRSEMAAAVENAYEAGARRIKNELRIVN